MTLPYGEKIGTIPHTYDTAYHQYISAQTKHGLDLMYPFDTVGV